MGSSLQLWPIVVRAIMAAMCVYDDTGRWPVIHAASVDFRKYFVLHVGLLLFHENGYCCGFCCGLLSLTCVLRYAPSNDPELLCWFVFGLTFRTEQVLPELLAERDGTTAVRVLLG